MSKASKLALVGELRSAIETLDAPTRVVANDTTFEQLQSKIPASAPEPGLSELLEDAPPGTWRFKEWEKALGALDQRSHGRQ